MVATFAVLILQGVHPQTAAAWWDYIEQLSGPGPMRGWDIEGRLVCFARKQPPAFRNALASYANAIAFQNAAKTAAAGATLSEQIALYGSVVEAWNAAARAWDQAIAWNVDEKDAAKLRAAAARAEALRLEAQAVQAETQAKSLPKPEQNALPAALESWMKAAEQSMKAAEQGSVAATRPTNVTATFTMAPVTGGFIYSACQLEDYERRRASVDFGMRFLWRQGDERFANGKRITLTTVEPAFSWHLVDNDRWDFIDYGVGAGYYWFSSSEFPSFAGGFLEPIRLDLHVPPAFIGKGIARPPTRNPTTWYRVPFFLAQFGLVRYGKLVFPGGFDFNRFVPNPEIAAVRPEITSRVGRDWARTYGVFVDLELITGFLKNRRTQ
jgi:hypothetical protein